MITYNTCKICGQSSRLWPKTKMIVVVILSRLMSYYFLHNIFFLIKHTLFPFTYVYFSSILSFPHISFIPNPIQHLQAVTYSLAKLSATSHPHQFPPLPNSSYHMPSTSHHVPSSLRYWPSTIFQLVLQPLL